MNARSHVEFAEHELAGKLMQLLIIQLEQQTEAWPKVSEGKQSIALNNMRGAIETAVKEAVLVIASESRPRMLATVESVTFKDGVKAVLSLQKTEGAHALADAEGSTALVIVGQFAAFAEGTEKVQATPGQPSLDLSVKTERTETEPGQIGLQGHEEGIKQTVVTEFPEVFKRKDHVFEIVTGPDRLHYQDSPESFKSAARAESWLVKHLEESKASDVAKALAAFKAAGEKEGRKPDDERNMDLAFAETVKAFPSALVEDNYADLSAACLEGFERSLDKE